MSERPKSLLETVTEEYLEASAQKIYDAHGKLIPAVYSRSTCLSAEEQRVAKTLAVRGYREAMAFVKLRLEGGVYALPQPMNDKLRLMIAAAMVPTPEHNALINGRDPYEQLLLDIDNQEYLIRQAEKLLGVVQEADKVIVKTTTRTVVTEIHKPQKSCLYINTHTPHEWHSGIYVGNEKDGVLIPDSGEYRFEIHTSIDRTSNQST